MEDQNKAKEGGKAQAKLGGKIKAKAGGKVTGKVRKPEEVQGDKELLDSLFRKITGAKLVCFTVTSFREVGLFQGHKVQVSWTQVSRSSSPGHFTIIQGGR